MKNRRLFIIGLVVVFMLSIVSLALCKDAYYCPMHPSYTSDKPGDCPICNMKLVKKEEAKKSEEASKKERKIIFYRNPMNAEVTSAVPMTDQMGMDYIPVYEEDVATAAGVFISQEKQQLIGVKKGEVVIRDLVYEINTVGRVVYDPQLYVAQQEFLQALKSKKAMSQSMSVLIKEQSERLLLASEKKLLLLGMSKAEIENLAKENAPQEGLYLPMDEDRAWVYVTIYEYEMGLVKIGQEVSVEAVAYPGEEFKGQISAITPVLESMTRSVRIRAEVNDPQHLLKPEMFVNVIINIDLGKKLSVPEEAVMDTGERQVVFIASSDGHFVGRDVKLGNKAQGFYEVLEGLKEGEAVVTSGNFLIDSESKLKAAVSTETHQPRGDGLASDSQSHQHGQ